MLGVTRRNGETAPAPLETTRIARWDPQGEFSRVRGELDRLLTTLFGPTPLWVEPIGGFTPAVDLYETAEEVVVQAYLPGINREDLRVEVLGDTIHITGETRRAIPEKEVTVHLAEGTCGTFDLRYTLPVEVKPDKCLATYRNGVLEVRLPKAETAKPKPIEVRIEP